MTASVSHIRSTAPRTLIREVLSSARSVSEAARAVGMNHQALRRYCMTSLDRELTRAYANCSERGRMMNASARDAIVGPEWAVWWADPRTPGRPVRIWTVYAETEELAFDHAVKATGREATTLTVEECK